MTMIVADARYWKEGPAGYMSMEFFRSRGREEVHIPQGSVALVIGLETPGNDRAR